MPLRDCRMRTRFVIAILLSLEFSGCQPKPANETVGATSLEHFLFKALNAHILSVEPKGDKIEIVSDGYFSGVHNNFSKETIIGVGEQVFLWRDDHWSASLFLKEIKKESVVLTYESFFEFGGRIEKEKQDLELPFKRTNLQSRSLAGH